MKNITPLMLSTVLLGLGVSARADIYQIMTDQQATTLANKVFGWEEKRTKLKRTWFKKFSKAVPAKKAAQFFQIENQLNAALDLQLAAALPLIK